MFDFFICVDEIVSVVVLDLIICWEIVICVVMLVFDGEEDDWVYSFEGG